MSVRMSIKCALRFTPLAGGAFSEEHGGFCQLPRDGPLVTGTDSDNMGKERNTGGMIQPKAPESTETECASVYGRFVDSWWCCSDSE